MGMRLRFEVLLTPDEQGGFTVTVPAVRGCISQGETVEEALFNIKEALGLHLEPLGDAWEYPKGSIVQEVEL